MHRNRLLAATSVAAILAAGPLTGLAGAATAPKGVGSSAVRATALAVRLGANGDLLTVRVLDDEGLSNIDLKNGALRSTESLLPVTVSSKLVPGLGFAAPPLATSSTGAEDRKSAEPTLPSSPAFSGSVNAVLSSVVDAAGARSGLQAGLANLRLAGGLVNVPTGVVQVASAATSGKSSGSRSITIPEVRVLDLAAVLDGIGLKLTDLSVDQLLGLLDGLGIALPGIADPAAVVATLNTAIDTLQAAVGPITTQLCNTIDGLLGGQLGGVTGLLGGGALGNLPTTIGTLTGSLPALPLVPGLPGITPALPPVLGGLLGGLGGAGFTASALPVGFSCTNLIGTTQQLLDQVQGTLAKVLTASLVELADVSLLSVKDVKVGLVADAVSTIEGSVADVTASIGSVKVGELPIPGVAGLDLAAPAGVINSATAAIQNAIAGVLTPLNASLASLVDVDLLDIKELVAADGGYTRATSTVTAVRAALKPPALLGSSLLDLGGVSSGNILGTLGSALPPVAALMGQLEAALGGLNALSAPAEVAIGELSGTAAFRPVSAASAPGVAGADPGSSPAPGGTLPRTGGQAALPAVLAVGLGGVALALRRVLRSVS